MRHLNPYDYAWVVEGELTTKVVFAFDAAKARAIFHRLHPLDRIVTVESGWLDPRQQATTPPPAEVLPITVAAWTVGGAK